MAKAGTPTRSVPHCWPKDWPIPAVEERNEAARFLHEEAARIIYSQKALIAAGHRKEPDENQLRRAISFHNVGRFMDVCAPHRKQVLDYLNRLLEQRQT